MNEKKEINKKENLSKNDRGDSKNQLADIEEANSFIASKELEQQLNNL